MPRTWFLNTVGELPITGSPPAEAVVLVCRRRDRIRTQRCSACGDSRGQKDQFILQERLSFEPVIETPHGATQVEIRMMCVWTDRLRAVLPLLRMGRGQMMGVDHNKGLQWVGASAGFIAD